MNQLASSVERALGAHVRAEDLTILQIALRAVLVFLVWLAIVRMADRRLLGKYSAFDVVLAVMLCLVVWWRCRRASCASPRCAAC